MLKDFIEENVSKKTSQKEVSENNDQKGKKNSLKTDKFIFRESDNLLEESMKESINKVIVESSLDPDKKLDKINKLYNEEFTEDQKYKFGSEIVKPAVDFIKKIRGKDINKNSKPVNMLVYEIASILESARYGFLENDDIDNYVRTNYIDDPAIQEPSEDEAEQKEIYPGNFHAEGGSTVNNPSEDDASGVVADDIMGDHLTNTQQYEDMGENQKDLKTESVNNMIYEENEGPADTTDEVAYEPNSVNDIKAYEGRATHKDYGVFYPYVGKTKDVNEDYTEETEPEFNNVEDVKGYEGQPAANDARTPPAREKEFKPVNNIDQMIKKSGELVAMVFEDYGIEYEKLKEKIVNEALAVLAENNFDNIHPNLNDISEMVYGQYIQHEQNEAKTPYKILYNVNNLPAGNVIPKELTEKAHEDIENEKYDSKNVKMAYGIFVECIRKSVRNAISEFDTSVKQNIIKSWSFNTKKDHHEHEPVKLESLESRIILFDRDKLDYASKYITPSSMVRKENSFKKLSEAIVMFDIAEEVSNIIETDKSREEMYKSILETCTNHLAFSKATGSFNKSKDRLKEVAEHYKNLI